VSRPYIPFLVLATMLALAACGASPQSATPASAEPSAAAATAPASSSVPLPSAPASVPSLPDLDTMAASELPEGVPVPVPAGGAIDDTLSVTEGQSLVVEFPASMYDTIATFYDAWFASEGIPVPPEFVPDGTRAWRPDINGQAVELQLYEITNAEGLVRLSILWP
jgi:hypothetical protein